MKQTSRPLPTDSYEPGISPLVRLIRVVSFLRARYVRRICLLFLVRFEVPVVLNLGSFLRFKVPVVLNLRSFFEVRLAGGIRP
jgi:hypothetical protein